MRTNQKQRWFNSSSLLVFISCSPCAYTEAVDMETIKIVGQPINGLHGSQHRASNRLGLTALELPGSSELITEAAIDKKADYTPLFAVTRATGISSVANPGNGGTALSVRGFTGHNAVVQTFDGTRLYVGAGTVTFPADSWTLANIEVLRGPASVIHGVGGIGANINYVAKKPEFTAIQQELEVNTGSNGLFRLGYGSTGQLSGQVAYRLDALFHESDGYVELGDEERQVLSGSITYQPQDDLTITFSLDYSDIDAAAYWGTPLVNGQIKDAVRETSYNIEDNIVNYQDFWPRVKVDWQINDTTSYHSDTYYIAAERHWRNVESYAFDAASNQIERSSFLEILHDQKQIGHRSDITLDFTSTKLSHKVNLGLEANQIEFTHTNNRPYEADGNFVDIDSPNHGYWDDFINRSPTDKDFTSDTFQYALFVDYRAVINPQVSLVTGLRYDEIDFDREDFKRLNDEQSKNIQSTLSGTSWRLGVVYQPQDNTSLYGQISQAVGSIQSILSATNPELDLSTGTQKEVGIKQALWDNKAQFTFALFDITLKDFLAPAPQSGEPQRQVGEQTSQGVELEWYVKARDNIDTTFNITWLDTEFKDHHSGNTDLSGKTPRNVPSTTANLWIDWRFSYAWELSGGARYVGQRYINDDNTKELPAYTVYDTSLQWAATPKTTLALRAKNLTDEQDFILSSYGEKQWVLGPGRQFEIGVNYSF